MPPDCDHPWIDSDHKPLYVLTIPQQRVDGELQAAVNAISETHRHVSSPIAWIVDASALLGAVPSERQIMVDAEKRNAHYSSQFNVGTAVVAPSAIVRGIYTAITWLAPLVYPSKVVRDVHEARRWTNEQLTAAGVELPRYSAPPSMRPGSPPIERK